MECDNSWQVCNKRENLTETCHFIKC